MSVRGSVFAVLLCALLQPPLSSAQSLDFETVFNGMVGERRVVAVSVQGAYSIGDLIDALRLYAAPDTTLIAYINHEALSETQPLVVYENGENVFFTERPAASSDPPTFADTMQSAMQVTRGAKVGAICRDGSRTDRTNNGACSFNGGLDRWLYDAVARSDAEQVVAAICTDYRLVSGDGTRCGESEVLTEVYARLYPAPREVDPAEFEPREKESPPSERAAAPLPEPEVVPPAVTDSRVSWTSRSNGNVQFTWTTTLSNPNDQPVRALVKANLRDAAGEIIYTDERFVAIGAGASGDFTDEGAVSEQIAMRADRWSFDVTLAEEDAPLTPEQLAAVAMEVDGEIEEVRITNISDAELDMNGWTLVSTVGGESFTFRFFRLAPGATVTLTSGEGARSMLPEVYLWTSSDVWKDQTDAAELRDAQGRLRARNHPGGS